MPDSFDAVAIKDRVARRLAIEEAAALNKRLIDCPDHNELYAQLDKLAGYPSQKHMHKKPSATIEATTTVYVYGKDGEKNLEQKQTLASAGIRYDFPDGLTVTRLRKAPLTYRLDGADGRQLVICRQRVAEKDPWHWEVMNKSGFTKHKGKRAGHRFKGKSADRSFD